MSDSATDSGAFSAEGDTNRVDPIQVEVRNPLSLSLFWRTFLYLLLLLVGSVLVWLQTLRILEDGPRNQQNINQIVSVVSMAKTALTHVSPEARKSLLEALARTEGMRVVPQTHVHQVDFSNAPSRGFYLRKTQEFHFRLLQDLTYRLNDPGIELATRVNSEAGLWIGLNIDRARYWIYLDPMRIAPVAEETWYYWQLTIAVFSLVCAAIFAWLINLPYKKLANVALAISAGRLKAERLDEGFLIREIQAINRSVNRMTRRLSRVEEDRTTMLAGLSHDLRTPLSRLRLETEMSVEDTATKEAMISDIEHIDGMIDKFILYAQPTAKKLAPVQLNEIITNLVSRNLRVISNLQCDLNLEPNLWILADPVEVSRVVNNLIENARRYGKTPETGQVYVEITAQHVNQRVYLSVRDHGTGVPDALLDQLATPFFRGDFARTEAAGSGLGLAIVEKIVRHMSGSLHLSNHIEGGFLVKLYFAAAYAPIPSLESAQGDLLGNSQQDRT